ncbi:MAG TPA: oligosaccharide flippase family protein [Solirubrobacteraceae bacterium]
MPRESLKEATLSGVRWLMLTRVASEALGLVAMVALARHISPAAFGHAAVALIFLPLAAILTFEGFASALVQREEIDADHLQAATLMSLLGGALLSALALGLTPILWRPVFGVQTAALMALASPVFLLAGIGGVPRALLWRRLDFRRMGLIDTASLIVGSVLAVALALEGVQARAIIWGALAQVAVRSLLLLATAPPPPPRLRLRAQREIGAFGVPAALAGLVDVLFRNVDYAILAARLPAAQTGIYWRAFNLGVVYQDKLSGVMMQLAFPVYSRTESHTQLRGLHERATKVHAAVIFPLLAMLIVVAPVLIPWLLGPQWAPSVVPTQILAVAGMVAAILTGYPQVMLALGHPHALLRFNVAMLLGYAAVVLLASSHGLIVVAVAVTAFYLVILIGVYRLLLSRYLGISIRGLISELAPALGGCLALASIAMPLRILLAPTLAAPFVVVLVGVSGLLAYMLALRVVSPAVWRDLHMLLARVLPLRGRNAGYEGAKVAQDGAETAHHSTDAAQDGAKSKSQEVGTILT